MRDTEILFKTTKKGLNILKSKGIEFELLDPLNKIKDKDPNTEKCIHISIKESVYDQEIAEHREILNEIEYDI